MTKTRTSTWAAACLLIASCGGSATAPTADAGATTVATTEATVASTTSTTAAPTTTRETRGRVNATTSGEIDQDETWAGEIHLTGDVMLADDVTLTIEPGTTVFVASLSDDQHCCRGGYSDEYTRAHDDPTDGDQWNSSAILIDGRRGTIYAVGTPDERITFQPEGDSTSPAQWDGVYIAAGTIQYADLFYGGHTAIQIVSASQPVEIAHNTVRHFLWAGIDSHSDDAWIHHNVVEGGGHQAISVRNNTRAEHNIVIGAQTGIGIEQGFGALVRNNIIIDTARGIELRSGTSMWIHNNTIVWIDGPPDGWYFGDQLVYPAFLGGGGIEDYLGNEKIQILNNIVFGPFGWGIGLHDSGSLVDANLMFGQREAYSGPGQSTAGSNSLTQDPLFVDASGWDFHLLDGSPAIDAGDPSLLDADGSPSDLGAYGGPEGDSW